MNEPTSEFDLIRRFFRVPSARNDVQLAVGDDAALVIPECGGPLAMTLDTLLAGVHFPHDAPVEAIGHKALAVNLSDLAALGADPAWAMLALTLPAGDADWVEAFMRGWEPLARAWNVDLIGGDTTCGPLTITVQASGYAPQPLRRDGARVGDRLWVSGAPGEAGAGLRCWQRGDRGGQERETLIDRLHRPQPRVALGLALRGVATAVVDVSVGLLADAGHIAERSGLALRGGADVVPLAAPLRAIAGAAALDLALNAGDDYGLCFTAPADRDADVQAAGRAAGIAVTAIGVAESGAGVSARDGSGRLVRVGGYRHFGSGA